MLSRLISGVCKLFRSNSMPCRTHVDLDLQRWDCREVSHAHQVVGCAGEAEDPVHFAHSAMPHFAQQGDRLQPAETLFDALSLLLTETIAGMLCRAPVDCAPTAPCQVLRHMGRHSQMSTLGHEIPSVEALISAHGHRLPSRNLLQHHQRRIALRPSVGHEHFCGDDQSVATGDEIAFPVPADDALGPEIYVTKASSTRTRTCLYLAPVGYASKPKLDKREQGFVSAQIRAGNLGISSVFLACEQLRDYFYRIATTGREPVRATLYETLHIEPNASPAEIRVAFKLRNLELKMIGAARSEQVKLERAFNILGHPELRAHYDALLIDPEVPATFPYGGFGSLLVTGERSRDGETFFARRILAFLPEQRWRRFHLPLRSCYFYRDRAVCRDVRRHLEFWLDPVLLHV